MKSLLPLAFVLAAPAAAVTLQADPPRCEAVDAALPETLAAWRTPVSAGATIAPGQTVTVPLRPIAAVETIVPPRPAREGATTGARLELEIASAGTYGVALDSGAWVELIHDGRPIQSAAHGHGPACSSIRKIVDFRLAPGRYQVQLSGTAAASVRLLVLAR